MKPEHLFQHYQDLQHFVGWTDADARHVQSAGPLLTSHIPELVHDFYAEVSRHPGSAGVITGGEAQVDRLRGTLTQWLYELLSGDYGEEYVNRRWKVGYRHVEIGLAQVYTNVAISRLRSGLSRLLEEHWNGPTDDLLKTIRSFSKLLDLDLAIIEDAYQAAYTARQQSAERLATIGQVAGGIAHELRNPLNVIKTSVYYLVNARNPNPAKTDEHLSRIEKQVGQADSVISALSNFAKLPLPNLDPFSLEECIHETLETTSLPENVTVQIHSLRSLPFILGDKEQMRIVFGNLFRNASDAMPEGGTLTISSQQSERDGGIVISVSDTGEGIDPEILSRVMEPLFTTKARGIGLGLAMARAIVDKNNGHLDVTSTLGQGTTFSVSLHTATESDQP